MSLLGLHTYYLQIVDCKGNNWESIKTAILDKPFEALIHADTYEVKLQWSLSNTLNYTLVAHTYNHEDVVRFVTDLHLDIIKKQTGDFRHILLKDVTIDTNKTFGGFSR